MTKLDELGWSRRRAMAALGMPTALASTISVSATTAGSVNDPGPRSQMLSVTDVGAIGDGRADDTRAFQETVDRLAALGGGVMIIPPGTFRTQTVCFPYEPVVIHTIGAGTSRTVWEMAEPDRPIIAIDPRSPPKRSLGARFEGFSVRAHPQGRADNDSHIAINCIGFSNATFESLRFLSNGKGTVGAWFHTAAHPHLTYQQRFADLVCHACVGPGRILRTASAGTAATNANILTVENFWIYASDGIDTAFDFSHATTYVIRSGLIESSGRDGIRLGDAGIVESVWMEDLKGAPIVFAGGPSVSASHNILRDIYLSGFDGEIVIPSSCANNILSNVTGGLFTVRREDLLGGNIVVNSGAPRDEPRIVQFSGPKASLRMIQAVRVSALGERWTLNCHFTPAGKGTYGFRLAPPTGSRLTSVHASALISASGIPCTSSAGWPLGEIFVTTTDARSVSIIIQLTLE